MDNCNNSPKICIIGAGFSGLCAAIQLQKQLNIDNYTLFDENEDVGGTWLVNTYPGCACDIASHLYSFSFAPNPYWTKAYSGQEEIWRYLQDVAKQNDLYPKMKFQHRVTSLQWDDKIEKWHLKVLDIINDKEDDHIFDIIISGVGGLRVPNWPKQFEPFQKPKMHSARWDSSIELKDKVVAIVGSGASAVQIIPEIADKVKRLVVYQRHPAWVVPKMQMNFPNFVKWAFATIPGVQWTLRSLIFWSFELNHFAFKTDSFLSRMTEKLGNWQLDRQIPDGDKREKLRPNYSFGCKRVTPSNEYYPALARSNVTVINSPITDVTEDSILNEDGTIEKPDVLILATGFKVQDFFAPLKITAKAGEDLLRKWQKDGPCAYAGIACHTMPNAFFLLGPNTGLGHNSIVFPIECQVNWTIKIIAEMTKRNARTVAIKKSAEDDYMTELNEKMKGTVWGSQDCGSYYADHRGRITALYPDNLVSYYKQTKSVDFSILDFN